MKLSGTRLLNAFERCYPDAKRALAAWELNITSRSFRNFSEIRQTFGSADIAGPWTIFNIRGNNYRLFTTIDLVSQSCHIESILTHAEYDSRGRMKTFSVREPACLGWRPFEHPSTVKPIQHEGDYDAALAVVSQLGTWGAAEGHHPQNMLLGLILMALRAYEKVNHPRHHVEMADHVPCA